jgi:hypothetical protein
MTEPTPSLGILYVHPQALMRHQDKHGVNGSHEGKVTEALFFTHAAGWSSKVITPRGATARLTAQHQSYSPSRVEQL